MTFTQVFGGGTLDPAQPSYKAYTSTTSIAAVWPIEAAASNNVVAAINDISFTAGLTFTMPPADEVSVGYNAVFNNVGSNAFTVLDNAAGTVLTASAGSIWTAYVADNTTASGTYRVYQNGAGTSSASAAALAGLGLVAITTTLNSEYETGFSYSVTPQTMTVAQRAGLVIWTGGAGVFNFSALATLTAGWWCAVTNQGTGALVLTPPSGTIDGSATKTLNPGDTCIVITNATNMYTLGFGQDAAFAFTFLIISVAGLSGTYTLSGLELNKTAIRFTGALAGALDIIVPSTVQQYWIDNETTGFAFGIRTVTQASPGVDITSTARDITYCDGTNVVRAETVGISTPLTISLGGTSATSAANARTNLDVPSNLEAFTFALFLS